MVNFSQQHPHWKNIRLGTSWSTIGGYGCLLCSVASYVADTGLGADGRRVDPGSLNRWLARHGGYAGGNLFIFNSLAPLGVELVDYVDCFNTPAPIDAIAEALYADFGVVVEVDFAPGGGRNQHWVRILKHPDAETVAQQRAALDVDALIMDPWMPPGYERRWLMPAYALPIWDNPARAIFRVAIYAAVPSGEPLKARRGCDLLNTKPYKKRIVQENLNRA